MKSLIQTVMMISVIAVVLLTGCKQSMVISQVDYSQSIESVLQPDEDGTVEDPKHGITFNIKPIQYAETQDTSSVTTKQVRYIRGNEGYYYITAPDYKNVYVMAPEKGKLVLKETLKIGDKAIAEPAFNQRNTHIQLVNRSTGDVWKVHEESIEKEE
ncbi:hypothetical protein CK503_00070 [Aliifodinibius salipaludis]|uniref:Lipoprotein n=1 Tax=Fodinibius salipaludis TaxID=2032627 RepID=A0A2A2GEZ6_9BACT|nr:hypothetical protein [Aliifodinibius salipaludis]PAU95497.1 hypothetical protein CK503_00070 [Aliifodinibius salipaludis]